MNCSQQKFLWFVFVTLLLSSIIVKSEANEANVQVQADNSTIHLQCPYVRGLSAQKKEKLENGSSKITKKIFSFLFPGSPLVNSLLGTFYISSIPNFILYFVPPDIQPSSLNSLVSFAVGGLLGDVFLHLLPHSFLGENNDDEVHFVQVEEQKNVVIGLAIFVGLTTFLVIDKLMRVANGGEGDHSHSHDTKENIRQSLSSAPSNYRNKDVDGDDEVVGGDVDGVDGNDDNDGVDGNNGDDSNKYEYEWDGSYDPEEERRGLSSLNEDTGKTTATRYNSTSLRQRASTNKTMKEENEPSKQLSNSIKLSAYLNLIADAAHNFTDGLAMAASFYTSPSIGATTTVAVFFHEIPHEIGDYAILIQGGFTKKRAMLSQFITAIGAFLGTLAGIVIEEYSKSVQNNNNNVVNASDGILGTGVVLGDLVIPFTAGGFLYIATVGVIPELLKVSGKLSKDIRQAVTEFLAMFIGITMMAVIAWNEGT